MENSDEYLTGEIDHLSLAVENEEALEAIRAAIRRRQQQQDGGGEGEGEEDEEEEKKEEEAARIADDDAALAKTLLRAKLKKFLVDSAARDLRESGYEDQLEAGEGEDGEDVMEGYEGSPHLFPKGK